MIDVHPAHHAATTWREFLIHIATIVLGLCIAVGLEQAVEFFHHREQRLQLEADLHDEAQRNIGRIEANEKLMAMYMDWDRAILKAGRDAKPFAGFVTFVIPARGQLGFGVRPLDNIWPAAKASGTLAVLPREEVETFGRVSDYADQAEKSSENRNAGISAENTAADRLGLTLAGGATVRITPAERDELMRAVALHLEGFRRVAYSDAYWQGASIAVLHGARSPDEMAAYTARAVAALPK